jgi:hypothetical protein
MMPAAVRKEISAVHPRRRAVFSARGGRPRFVKRVFGLGTWNPGVPSLPLVHGRPGRLLGRFYCAAIRVAAAVGPRTRGIQPAAGREVRDVGRRTVDARCAATAPWPRSVDSCSVVLSLSLPAVTPRSFVGRVSTSSTHASIWFDREWTSENESQVLLRSRHRGAQVRDFTRRFSSGPRRPGAGSISPRSAARSCGGRRLRGGRSRRARRRGSWPTDSRAVLSPRSLGSQSTHSLHFVISPSTSRGLLGLDAFHRRFRHWPRRPCCSTLHRAARTRTPARRSRGRCSSPQPRLSALVRDRWSARGPGRVGRDTGAMMAMVASSEAGHLLRRRDQTSIFPGSSWKRKSWSREREEAASRKPIRGEPEAGSRPRAAAAFAAVLRAASTRLSRLNGARRAPLVVSARR